VKFTGGKNPSLILAQIPDGTVMEAPSLVAHGVITDTGGTVRIAYHVWRNSKPTPQAKGTRIVRVATVTWPGGKPHVS
jgi:hypothetical protein